MGNSNNCSKTAERSSSITYPVIVGSVNISAHAKVGNLDKKDSRTTFGCASLGKLVHQAVATSQIPVNIPLRREVGHSGCNLTSNRHQICLLFVVTKGSRKIVNHYKYIHRFFFSLLKFSIAIHMHV